MDESTLKMLVQTHAETHALRGVLRIVVGVLATDDERDALRHAAREMLREARTEDDGEAAARFDVGENAVIRRMAEILLDVAK